MLQDERREGRKKEEKKVVRKAESRRIRRSTRNAPDGIKQIWRIVGKSSENPASTAGYRSNQKVDGTALQAESLDDFISKM